jgi:hypothetical protein
VIPDESLRDTGLCGSWGHSWQLAGMSPDGKNLSLEVKTTTVSFLTMAL